MVMVWRLNISPEKRVRGLNAHAFCQERGILGIGWPVPGLEGPVTSDVYVEKAKAYYEKREPKGEQSRKKGTGKFLEMKVDDLCWTRDQGDYYLCRITGEWEYRSERDYVDADILQVRSAEWYPVGREDSVPNRVAGDFRGGTCREIDDSTVNLYSRIVFNEKSGREAYSTDERTGANIFSLMSPDSDEDIVAIFLQEVHGYKLIASTCKRSTARYEFFMKRRGASRKGAVQAKKGRLDPVDYQSDDLDVYLFSASGEYGAKAEGVECLDPSDIERFMWSNRDLMPDTVVTWMDWIGS
jgi:hypothetical protein